MLDTKVFYLCSGFVGGSHYTETGGGGEYICLPKNPKYDKYRDGNQAGSYIYGTEYEVSSYNPFKPITARVIGEKAKLGMDVFH